ncbi:MAG: transporter [bacterium]|nr:hypothetical protein [Deltaproteobacteria bacterium]MCP4904842.1 transporter [bacterium]
MIHPKFFFLILIVTVLTTLSGNALAYYDDFPDQHAPLGVMGDHLHDPGELMFSYRYSRMAMAGNRDGDDRASTSSVLADFMVAPTDMDMEMHMLGAMYGVNDQFTVMAMLPFVRKTMDHVTGGGAHFTTRSDGLGDIKISALYSLFENESHRVHMTAGLSIPTGSIKERGTTPMGDVRLPYPMQRGSGTWDLLPGLTYRGKHERLTWGLQAQGTIRPHSNKRHYRLGNQYEVSSWGAWRWTNWISTSARLVWSQTFNIEGADGALMPMVVPTADPKLRAGRRLDLLLGVNLAPRGFAEGHRLAIEVGPPVYQHLDGPQLETDWKLVVGWQWGF